jgi:hypothetical protein
MHIFEPLDNYIVLLAYQDPKNKIFYFLKTYHPLASLCLKNKARTAISPQIIAAAREYLQKDYNICVRQDFREEITLSTKNYGFYLATINNFRKHPKSEAKWLTFAQLTATFPHDKTRIKYLKVLQLLSDSHKQQIAVIEQKK